MTTKPTPRRRPNGYSMVEILIVLGIMAVLVALVAPNLSGMIRANRTDGLVSRMRTDVMQARMEAMRAGRRVDFVILGGTRYAVVRSAAAGGTVDTLRTVSLTAEFPGVTVSPASLTWSFDSRGLVTTTDGSVVRVTQGSATRRLEITSVGNIYRD